MRLMGRWAFGHACPCEGHIFTAAHLSHPFFGKYGYQNLAIGYVWSDAKGEKGYLQSFYSSLTRDIGLLSLIAGSPTYYKHAITEPVAGDEVYWVEYARNQKKDFFEAEHKKGKVLHILSGHIVIDGKPESGASGGCLFNAAGEVVGIVTWQIQASNGPIGIAASLAGPWWPEAK